jgi:hypothetical protein
MMANTRVKGVCVQKTSSGSIMAVRVSYGSDASDTPIDMTLEEYRARGYSPQAETLPICKTDKGDS